MKAVERWHVMDTWVNAFDTESLLQVISEAARSKSKILIGNHNVNSLALTQRDAEFASFYHDIDYCFIDGYPLVLLARLEGHPATYHNRLGVLDWFWQLLELCSRNNWTIMHVGSNEPTITAATSKIRSLVPGVQFECLDGFFNIDDFRENARVIDEVNSNSPRVFLVGMGMPRQERWISQNWAAMPDAVIIPIGGLLGYIGGDRPTAPRWLGRMGLEWAYRLLTEPSRLWRRYTLEPLVLLRPIGQLFLRRFFRPKDHKMP